jgi:hypothetical protein
MSVLSRQTDESAAIVENTENPLSEGAGNKAREEITAPALQGIASLLLVRRKKILTVRQRLAECRYDLNEGENAILDRLLEDLTT